MGEIAKFILGDKTYEFPVEMGTENEKAIDITKLRSESTYITMDNGFGNTGSCTSAITYLDGEKGILRYRGYPIEEIAKTMSFTETAYLLIFDKLPTTEELKNFDQKIIHHSSLPDEIIKIIEGYPKDGHPMGVLMAMTSALAGYYPKLTGQELTLEQFEESTIHLLAKTPTIAAYFYRRMMGKNYIAPNHNLDYISNFLHMMFSEKDKPYQTDKRILNAMRALLILHADHEQNCSTSTVRFIGSSLANIFASIAGGIGALWGPLHGGANQKVLEMLEEIQKAGGDVSKFIAKAKDPNDTYRLMGFGHRVYKNFDPRCLIIKESCHELFHNLGIKDPLLDIAMQLESQVLADDYFKSRKLYPNVDFYSGLIYKTIGIPTEMFTVLFAIGRLPGWIAHWKEMRDNKKTKIGRPRQVYTGATERPLTPIDQRS